MKTVLVIGSVNMDYTVYVDSFPKNGETILGKSRNIQPGGKGENQAIAVARSKKVRTDFIFAIGKDADGSSIMGVLKENNINAHAKICDNCETGNATIVVDSTSENKIIVVPGANNELKEVDINEDLLKQCDYVVLQNEIPEKVNNFVIKKAHELGKIVIYNPAPYRNIDEKLFNCIDYLIPNKGELENISGYLDPLEGAKHLIDKGIKNVIVTLGIDGSMLVNNNEIIKVPANKVKAVDTVAAGDTYVGYFVSSLAFGLSVKEAMQKASLASSITVSRKGSVNSIPFGNEVFI